MIDTDKYALVIDDDGYFCEDKIADLLTEVKRLRDIVCLLEDSRLRGLSIFDRPQLFDDVLQIHTQRNEQGNGDLPPFECVGEEE